MNLKMFSFAFWICFTFIFSASLCMSDSFFFSWKYSKNASNWCYSDKLKNFYVAASRLIVLRCGNVTRYIDRRYFWKIQLVVHLIRFYNIISILECFLINFRFPSGHKFKISVHLLSAMFTNKRRKVGNFLILKTKIKQKRTCVIDWRRKLFKIKRKKGSKP